MAHGEASAVRPSIKNLTRAKIFDEQRRNASAVKPTVLYNFLVFTPPKSTN